MVSVICRFDLSFGFGVFQLRRTEFRVMLLISFEFLVLALICLLIKFLSRTFTYYFLNAAHGKRTACLAV